MNEQQIRSLLEEYREDLGTCRKIPNTARRAFWRPGLVAIALTTAIAIGFFFLLSQDAAAGAVKKVAHALQSIKSMQVSRSEYRHGKWVELRRTYYRDSKWRSEAFLGTPLEVVYIRDKERILTCHKNLDHATIHPTKLLYSGWAPPEKIDILEYVTEWATNNGRISEPREVKLAECEPIDGRATYKIIMTRDSESYYCEIVVDQQSQLPVSSYYRFYNDESQCRETYKFDALVPDSMFSFELDRPVYDLPVEQAKLSEQWQKPLAQVRQTKVRDVSVTPDGTIWIAVTARAFESSGYLPFAVRGSGGQTYVPLRREINDSVSWGKERAKICGEEVLVFGFVALTAEEPSSSKVKVNFSMMSFTPEGFKEWPAAKRGNWSELNFVPRREPGEFPAYFVTLDLDNYCFQLRPSLHHQRAAALEDQKRWIEAARSYERAAEAYKRFIPSRGSRELIEAERCREQLRRPPLIEGAEASGESTDSKGQANR